MSLFRKIFGRDKREDEMQQIKNIAVEAKIKVKEAAKENVNSQRSLSRTIDKLLDETRKARS